MGMLATQEYKEYLNSSKWREKRLQRLAIGNFHCAACGSSKNMEVHHLTYDRIFNEDMADLLPLCARDHGVAEELISKRLISRNGNVLFLATETVRLILRTQKRRDKKTAKVVSQIENGTPSSGKIAKEMLLKEAWFIEALKLERKVFKKIVRGKLKNVKGNTRMAANAFVIYDTDSLRTSALGRSDLTSLILDHSAEC